MRLHCYDNRRNREQGSSARTGVVTHRLINVRYERIIRPGTDITQRIEEWEEVIAPAPSVQRRNRREVIGCHNGYGGCLRCNRRDIGRLTAAERRRELAEAVGELAIMREVERELAQRHELAQLRRAHVFPGGKVVVERMSGEVEQYKKAA